MERNRRHIERPHERRRKHMLAGVLLHMVTATLNIDQAMNLSAQLDLRWILQQMKNGPVSLLCHFCDP